ncbi:hypothetical protein LXA43DRAFT_973179 [Ganoderma leucocontextum]|nr:hypothetical protein LXA43DRAFT_973179 [Ganoderma leucocontextum]
MDGSDDYFDDDIVFDEQTLASIEQQEQRWQVAQGKQIAHPQQAQPVPQAGQRRSISREAPLPDPKRQKTAHDPTDNAVAVFAQPKTGEDYDEDLPDISIIGDGSYNFPAAQRASVNALAAQIRGQSQHTNGASTSPPSAPARPPQGRNKPARGSTLAEIEAALAAYASQVPPPTSTPAQNQRPSRASPAPGLARAPSFAGPSSSVRGHQQVQKANGPHAQRPTSRASSGSASVSPVERRHSTASPSVPPRQPPQQQQRQHQQRQQPQQQYQPPQPPQHPPPTQGSSERVLRIELEALRAQFEELSKQQEQTAKALEEAQNTRYAKEGEVSILRKGMEKTAKDHSAEVARIRAAKEQAEAAQAQLRKDMNAELERMKTQYIFKQHELETSNRKTPWSVRTKRDHGGVLTPVSSSSQRRQQAGPSALGDSHLQTPSRPRVNKDLPDSPAPQRRRKIASIPESPPKRTAKLPGFVNAFEPTTPKVATPKSNVRFMLSQASQVSPGRRKGKERAPVYDSKEAQSEDLFFNPPTEDYGPPPISQQDYGHRPISQPDSSPMEQVRELAPISAPKELQEPQSSGPGLANTAEPFNSSPSEDVEMKEAPAQPEPSEPVEPLLGLDWTTELHRIVLTHQHHSAKELSLQLLINHSIPATAPSERTQEYGACCMKLLQTLGTATIKLATPDETIRTVGEVLVGMGRVLCSSESIMQLMVLFDMMKIIALFVPAFVHLLLAPIGAAGSADAPPEILAMICDTIRDLLTPDNGLDEHRVALGSELLGLLEAICWNTPPESGMRLSVFVRKSGILAALVNPAQPTSFLHRTVRVLTLIASHPTLPKQFLSFPFPETPDEEDEEKDYTRIPHIERMGSVLVDRKRDEAESRPLRETILHFVTTIAVAHADCTNILLKSQTLLPSMILFLMNITDPLWEESEEFISSPELVSWTVQTMMRVVVLLYHLFTGVDSSATNLRHKLMVAPKRIFNGLWHMFTVTLGRISYAPPPESISPENQVKLEQICDLAKDVLELVVDGPELESIWAAFHVEDNVPAPRPTQTDEDEDESAARMQC